LQITNLSAGQVPGGKLFRARFEFGGICGVKDKVHQFTAMRRDQVTVRMCSVYIHEGRFYTIESGMSQWRQAELAETNVRHPENRRISQSANPMLHID